jgi:hypothetical protein
MDSPAFLHSFGSTSESESICEILSQGELIIQEIRNLGKQLGIEDVEERLSKCESMVLLRKLHWRFQKIGDILGMAEALKVGVADAGVLDKMTSRRVDKIHDELSTQVMGNYRERYLKTVSEQCGCIMFSVPPMEGNEFIVPIRDADELFKESVEMFNCVYLYVDLIMREKRYFYAVNKPQRATLEIRLGSPTANHTLGQLKLKKNLQPSAETLSFVNMWFKNAVKAMSKSPLPLP